MQIKMIQITMGVLPLLFGACVSSPWSKADCIRLPFKGYNVIACDDRAVGEHCRRGSRSVLESHKWIETRSDSGKPLDYYPRACTEFRAQAFGRKPTIAIGKSYMACLAHEIAHYEHPNDPAWVEKNYPCVGDKKK